MIGRFSCCSLQTVWSSDMRETLHDMAVNDSIEWVRNVSIFCGIDRGFQSSLTFDFRKLQMCWQNSNICRFIHNTDAQVNYICNKSFYLPMQKSLKITSKISSLLTCPDICPMHRIANRRCCAEMAKSVLHFDMLLLNSFM